MWRSKKITAFFICLRCDFPANPLFIVAGRFFAARNTVVSKQLYTAGKATIHRLGIEATERTRMGTKQKITHRLKIMNWHQLYSAIHPWLSNGTMHSTMKWR